MATVDKTAINIGVHILFQIAVSGFLGYIPRSGIAGSKGSFISNVSRKLHSAFHSGCSSLHSHQQCARVAFSPHHHQHLFVDSLMIAILTGVRSFLLVVLISISLMTSDIEHICMDGLEAPRSMRHCC